jgi:DnaJ-class molecular chaperone
MRKRNTTTCPDCGGKKHILSKQCRSCHTKGKGHGTRFADNERRMEKYNETRKSGNT